MGDNVINALVVGNPDSKINELIPKFEKLGNKGENSFVKIFDYQFKFVPFIIPKNGDVEIIQNYRDYDIIFLCLDYREDDSFNNIENFYLKNKHLELFYGLLGFYYETENKKVNVNEVKKFSKDRDIKLYNIVINSNFDRVFKTIITNFFEKKNKSSKIRIGGDDKKKLLPNIEDNVYICKIGLIGSKTGKTTLSQTYKTGNFNPNTTESTLINNVTKIINYTPDEKKKLKNGNESNSIKVKIELWDTPHVGLNWENMNFVMMVAKSVDVIIFLYDNNNKDTFYDIYEWDRKIHDNIVKNAIFCVVENQTERKGIDDFNEERSELASNIGAEKHFCIDASNRESVNDMIKEIVSFYLMKIDVVVEKNQNEINNEKNKNIENNINKKEKKENLNENDKKNQINKKEINNEVNQKEQNKKNKIDNKNSCSLF